MSNAVEAFTPARALEMFEAAASRRRAAEAAEFDIKIRDDLVAQALVDLQMRAKEGRVAYVIVETKSVIMARAVKDVFKSDGWATGLDEDSRTVVVWIKDT